jgi:LPS export ABC transporter protein LptC
MTRKVRILVAAFIVVSVIGLVALATVRYMARKGFQVVIAGDDGFGVKVSDIHYSRTREGRQVWVLDADSAASFTGSDEMNFNSVTLLFYARDGSTYTLKARKGTLSESTGEVSVEGDVLVESEDGLYRLTTDSLKYSSADARAVTDDRVEIQAKDLLVEGEGLIVDIDDERIFILNDVKALLKDPAI